MSTFTTTVKVEARVELTEEEAQDLPNPRFISAPVKITKGLLYYTYEGEVRGWVFTTGVTFYHRVKVNGELYKQGQDGRFCRHQLDEQLIRKFEPTTSPVATWVEEK